MTAEGIKQIAAILAEEYGVDFSGDRLAVWTEALKDITDDRGRAAVMQLIRSSSFPPKAADIVRLVHGGPVDPERLLDEEAELALRHIEEHICDYRINDWQHPVLHALVRSLNGVDAVVAMMGNGMWRMRWRDHKTLYKALRRRGVSPENPEGAPLTPQAISEGLIDFRLEDYAERGLPAPVDRHPFAPSLPVLPALPVPGGNAA